MAERGAATIWGPWNGNTADPAMISSNHVMLIGDLGIWLYEYLAGIAPDSAQPRFKHIVMKPHPVGGLKWVKAAHRSPHGLIQSDWRRDGSAFEWQMEVPANTTALVYTPARDVGTVTESGQAALRAKGVAFVKAVSDRGVFCVGSGHYHFRER